MTSSSVVPRDDFALTYLICPRTFARSRREVPVRCIGAAAYSSEKHTYEIIDGVPDFRIPINGRDPNGYDVIHGIQSNAESNRALPTKTFCNRLGLTPELVDGKTVLIAGTGLGNELRAVSLFDPSLVVAIDYSDYIRTIYRQSDRFHSNTVYLQADVMNLPFVSNCFDIVINAGVMHHARSPELGFREIHRVVKLGGIISIGSIYPPHEQNRMITVGRTRRRFHRMPPLESVQVLRRLLRSRILFERLGLGALHYAITNRLPLGNPEFDYETRFGEVLDYFVPEYRHIIDPVDVRQWFRDVGIEPKLPSNFRQFFSDASEDDFGSPTQNIGVKV